ncbi:MAG: hypothetical protein M1819_006741 [Sarea resinae]|nr:MAG: hypothetical protein M1819_006741 [Sarea resinae]
MDPSNSNQNQQPGPAQQHAQQPTQQPAQQLLIRVEQVRNLPHLNEMQKKQYADGVQKLWDVLGARTPDNPEYQAAHNKLVEVSQSIRASWKRWTTRQAQQSSMGQAQQNQQGQQSQQVQQNQQSQQGQPAPATATPQQIQAQQGHPPQAGNASSPFSQLAQNIQAHVNHFPLALPPTLREGTPESERWLMEAKLTYGRALQSAENAATSLKKMTLMVNQRSASGVTPTAEEQQKIDASRVRWTKQHADATKTITTFRKQQADIKAQRAQQQGGQAAMTQNANQGNQPVQQTAPPVQQPQNQIRQASPIQAPTAQNAAVNVRSQANAPVRASMSPSSPAPPQAEQAQPIASAAPAQSPVHSQTPQNSQVRPPLSIGVPQQPNPQHPQHQPQQPPQSLPQATQPALPQGPPRPLSHQAAMAQAARTYSNGNFAQTTPQSATTPHVHPQVGSGREQSNSNTKMPIPKNLNVTSPTPVAMGPARPTINGGPSSGSIGMMGQPAIPKHPTFQLEGEGDRVLSKKKLDELVRQVTGGGEGLGTDGLAPDVEEAILQVADDFIDQVITGACRLAKLRQSSTLEIRDIQLILERNYNIRVPGYASDEIRTVRKFAPTAGWTQKMNAVQAAKVMGGKGDL